MRRSLIVVGSIALCGAAIFLMGATNKDVIHYGCETEIQPVEGAHGQQYHCKFIIRDLAADTVMSTPLIVCLKGSEAQIGVKSKDIKDGVFAKVLVGDSGVEVSYSVELVREGKAVFAQSAKIDLSD